MIGVRSRFLASTRSVASLLVLATSLAACGGAAPAARTPSNAPASQPSSVEEAEAQIAAAKADLSRAFAAGASAGTSSLTPSPAPPAADSTSPEPAAAPKAPSRPGMSESSKSARTSDDRCTMPCRALASMRTAVTALCRMTGPEDARCVDAKRTLADSEARIAPCSC